MAGSVPGSVRNALEIAKSAGTEGLITHKSAAPAVGNFFKNVLTFGQHEGKNIFKDVEKLAILGRPTPPPAEICEWLALAGREGREEVLFWLLVSPVLQAIGRNRRLWEEENSAVFIIDRHLIQLQRFLLPYLGPCDLLFWSTDKGEDTAKKSAALRAAMKVSPQEMEEAFMAAYCAQTPSRQARHSWAQRFSRLQYFHQKWRAWWEFVKKQAGDGEKVPYSLLIKIFSQKIEEFLPRIFPRRGPPRQLSLSCLGGVHV